MNEKVILFINGGYILQECPNCGGRFTVSIEKAGKICNPAWCVVKNEPHDKKKSKKMVEQARLMSMASSFVVE